MNAIIAKPKGTRSQPLVEETVGLPRHRFYPNKVSL